MDLRDRVIELVKQSKMSQKEFAQAISAPVSTVNGWFMKENRSPSSEYIIPICKLFSVSCTWLLTGEEDAMTISTAELASDESELVDIYRKLSLSGKRQLIGKAYELADRK